MLDLPRREILGTAATTVLSSAIPTTLFAQPAAEPYQLIVSSFSKVLDQAEALL